MADEFEHFGEARPGALLAGFRMAGVPVIDGDGTSLTTSGDVIGIPWSMVWAAAVLPYPRARIPLSQIPLLFAADGAGGLDTEAASQALLVGLRDALAVPADRPGPARLARLVAEESTRAGGGALQDPATQPDQVLVSAATFTVLASAGLLASMDGLDTISMPRPPTPALAPAGCAEDEAGQIALWFMSKVAGGVSVVDSRGWEGPFRALVEHLGNHNLYRNGDLPVNITALKKTFAKVANAAAYLTAALSALSLIIALLTQSAEAVLEEGAPLKRTDSTVTDGETKTILVTVGTDYGKLDATKIRGLNCLLTMLVLLGNNTTFPLPGPLSGVEVKVRGGVGFGQGLDAHGSYVVLTAGLRRSADDDGQARFAVAGRAQSEPVVANTPTFHRRFSVHIESTADPVTPTSIGKAFLDDFLCGLSGGDALTCVDAVVDTVKQFYWDLGEATFDLTDYVRARPTFVVDAYSSTATATISDPSKGGDSTIKTEFVRSPKPMLSTVASWCDPALHCPLTLPLLSHTSGTDHGYNLTVKPICSYSGSWVANPDPTQSYVSIALPPDTDDRPLRQIYSPPPALIEVGSIDSEISCLHQLPSTVLPDVASQQDMDPIVMRSGAPVTLTWHAQGNVAGALLERQQIHWTWDQFITFHRVNPDGTPYVPRP